MSESSNIPTLHTSPTDLSLFAESIAHQNINVPIFSSCGQLMAESLLNNGKILSIGFNHTHHLSYLLTNILTENTDQPRPALPALSFQANTIGLANFRSVLQEEDFVVIFGCQKDLQRRDQVIEQCTEANCTSVLFTPNLNNVHSNDKTLEIRLEYLSQTTYQTTLSAICGYLVQTFLSSCTTILDLVKSDQIEVDPQERTLGAWVDDRSIRTTVSHNIQKSHPDLDRSHVEVHSFNGVVLLTGEVPNSEVRSLASTQARAVPSVRIAHNELAIRNNTSFWSRLGDSYIHKRIKLKHYREPILDSINIDVVVENNVAYLMGIVTREQGELAAQVTSLTRGVTQVVKVFEYVE